MIRSIRLADRRATLDRRSYEIIALVLGVLAGKFMGKRRRERRHGWDRRARPASMYHA